MTDRELIDGLLRHDRLAFQFLVNTYQQQVITTAHHFTGNLEDAEDLSQEIFVDVIRNIGSFRYRSSLSTWITRITINRSLTLVKRRNRNALFSRVTQIFRSDEGNMADQMATPHGENDQLVTNENRVILQKAIDRLPTNQRKALLLHLMDERSYKEIADIMETRLPAVESLIFRAKKNLQRYLTGYFSEYRKR